MERATQQSEHSDASRNPQLRPGAKKRPILAQPSVNPILDDADLVERLDKSSIEDVVELKISRFLDHIGNFYPENVHELIMSKVETNLKKSDFEDGKLVKTEISGKSIVLGQVNGKIYAMDSVCSHQDGPLEDGWLDDYNITCPWQQGIFDIRNGKASTDTNWVTDMKAYTVIVDDKSEIISIEI